MNIIAKYKSKKFIYNYQKKFRANRFQFKKKIDNVI